MIKKIFTILLIAISAALFAGIYGIIHDQITYSISPEYYTKFKFIQFNIVNENDVDKIKYPRIFVAIVGFLATWWFGLILGIILGIVGLVHKDFKTMYKISIKSILIAVSITFLVGILGLFYGKFYLANFPKSEFKNWYIPENLIDFKNFISVGSMHNFSYFGGIIGLIFGIIYSIKSKKYQVSNLKSHISN
jgi:ABC-type dipeptide/oligopeptide/nickel transport system permease component